MRCRQLTDPIRKQQWTAELTPDVEGYARHYCRLRLINVSGALASTCYDYYHSVKSGVYKSELVLFLKLVSVLNNEEGCCKVEVRGAHMGAAVVARRETSKVSLKHRNHCLAN